ncbi:BTB/POZ domain-containing protein 19 [Aplysia californica]|uniref:BTB/POZ domain-containing protein 19 n=1 Tax=Aplysia californica TaxID=6500 RepID=A0ABM0JBX0_APLCA|nr:BTB/POZ domain-containing protein 19 [Aplysia californica]
MSRRSHSSSSKSSPSPHESNMTQAGAETLVKGNIEEYARMMKKMVNNKEFSDLKFLIGPGRKAVYAHRCLLSARCAVFKAMFADKAGNVEKDVPLVLSDMSPEIFITMLEFIYTNCVTLSSKNAIDVLATSLEYGLDDLRDLCVDYMEENLTSTNACDVMQAAVTYNQNDLKEKTMGFIEDNSGDVFKSKSFQEISEDTLVSILRSSRLSMDELELYRAVKEWATVNSVVNGRKVHEVAREAVKHIRLPLLSAEELTGLEDESKKDSFMPVGSFAYAWKLHALKQGEKENILSIRRRGTSPRDHHKYLTDQNSK